MLKWSNKWKITFQPTKTRDLIFTQKSISNVPTIKFDKKNIMRVNRHKHLGVYLTTNLDWAEQIKYVSLRANQKLGVLRQIRFVNINTLDML